MESIGIIGFSKILDKILVNSPIHTAMEEIHAFFGNGQEHQTSRDAYFSLSRTVDAVPIA